MSEDTPLIPEDAERAPQVIDLAAVRIAWGLPPRSTAKCKHQKLVYNDTERRVWCEDCERTLDGYDAFMVLTRNFQGMMSDAKSKHRAASDAASATIVRRAAKDLDRCWSYKMAAACPHCQKGLLPEDFANGASSAYGRDYELARRERDRRRALDQVKGEGGGDG